ncbi:PAS domain-containing sensor histidine kinase [Devosia sp. Leaf64]|uniref:PAS domain-containing sensor histidine kinase n=1 Tax=Devosia sp. Leaf64 TaxID=1736229 RepID=UPI00071457E4|nr:PAS domain-containing sensor histidine kinase [Devosia sp. Leaf64]KQN77854.1 PAS domain-containing sensor histidine kinase [Devosia sp. Leaf64]
MTSSDQTDNDFQDLYENAPCGYLSLGADGRIVRVNTTLCNWLGRTPDALIGKRLRDLLNVAGSIFYETHFAPLLRMQGFFEEVALDLVMQDGTTMPVLANAAERRLEEAVLTRVTLFRAPQRRRYERELGEARRQLEERNAGLESKVTDAVELQALSERNAELREQFIAVLGHDLRNPLAGLSGGTKMLAQIHADPKSVRILRLMNESIARMSGLTENLMDFARGRLGGGIGIQRTTGVRIEPLLAQVVNEMKAGYPERDIQMRFDLSQPVDVDHARLAQMFSNLLGNAITHGSDEQPVVVEARMDDGEFELSVANGGEPIPQAALDRLFQPFYRGEVRPSAQGLGLGLYIASQIAQAHHGRIDVTSDEIETKFVFRMPMVKGLGIS